MKILQINKFYYRRRGAEAYLLDLKDILEKNGHEVGIFSMHHPENIQDEWNKYFVSNIELSKVKLNFKAAGRMFWSFEAQKKLEQLLLDFKPDVAHIHNIYHQISPSILTTLKKHNIPVVQTLHDYKLLCPNYKMFTEGKTCERCKGKKFINCTKHKCIKNSFPASLLVSAEMYFHNWLKVYQQNVDCFISPSEFLKQKINEWQFPARRIEVINNFVNTDESRNVAPGRDLSLHFQNSRHYILYFGGLSEEKGLDLLIDNFAKINYDGLLHIVGTGLEEEKLKKMAKGNDKIVFKGYLKGEQLQNEIKNAKFVVLPSKWYENYPISALEAMAYGKCVLAANIGGIPEIVKDNETGILFDQEKDSDLAEKMKSLLSNEEQIKTLGQSARQFIVNNLDPQEHYEKIIKIYQNL